MAVKPVNSPKKTEDLLKSFKRKNFKANIWTGEREWDVERGIYWRTL